MFYWLVWVQKGEREVKVGKKSRIVLCSMFYVLVFGVVFGLLPSACPSDAWQAVYLSNGCLLLLPSFTTFCSLFPPLRSVNSQTAFPLSLSLSLFLSFSLSLFLSLLSLLSLSHMPCLVVVVSSLTLFSLVLFSCLVNRIHFASPMNAIEQQQRRQRQRQHKQEDRKERTRQFALCQCKRASVFATRSLPKWALGLNGLLLHAAYDFYSHAPFNLSFTSCPLSCPLLSLSFFIALVSSSCTFALSLSLLIELHCWGSLMSSGAGRKRKN